MSNQTNTNNDSTEIVSGLLNAAVPKEIYASEEQYRNHIFEQYKIYVEMADKMSERRNLLNAFFLTLHSFFLTGLGLATGSSASLHFPLKWMIIFPALVCIALCYVWWRLIISYGQLNTAKYKVIGQFEKLLPTSPYWSAEWHSLGLGKNRKLYWPVSDLENKIPIAFAVFYLTGAVWFAFS